MTDLFALDGRVAVVTGGTGALGSVLARALADAGAAVGILARDRNRIEAAVADIAAAGGTGFPLAADVLERQQLEAARDLTIRKWGHVDILVNAAGGNLPQATVGLDQTYFDQPGNALDEVFRLNVNGTLLACQVFGPGLIPRTEEDSGRSIVNISSMAAGRALSRVVGYGAAKAAVENFTRWLAVDCARRYGDRMRVNAIAPGFLLSAQNRALLLQPDGQLTERGRAIIDHTPAGRLGEPSDLISTLFWLCSPASRYVTGIVIPVDGGFSAWSGI